jgi:hypothetical protein
MKETSSIQNTNALVDYFERLEMSETDVSWEKNCLSRMNGKLETAKQKPGIPILLFILLAINIAALYANNYLKNHGNFENSKEKSYKAIARSLFVNPS